MYSDFHAQSGFPHAFQWQPLSFFLFYLFFSATSTFLFCSINKLVLFLELFVLFCILGPDLLLNHDTVNWNGANQKITFFSSNVAFLNWFNTSTVIFSPIKFESAWYFSIWKVFVVSLKQFWICELWTEHVFGSWIIHVCSSEVVLHPAQRYYYSLKWLFINKLDPC